MAPREAQPVPKIFTFVVRKGQNMCSIMGWCGISPSEKKFKEGFEKTISRGPDMSRIINTGHGLLGFHRLAIMGLDESGMQPFSYKEKNGKDSYVVCNGELYGFRILKEKLEDIGYVFESKSDCELILPLYKEYGCGMFSMLDAEFAMIIYDAEKDKYVAARDPIGIRPMFYGYDKNGEIIFASEAKNLVGLCDKIIPFPPGYYYDDGEFHLYRDMSKPIDICSDSLETACGKIRDKLIEGIKKRLDADAPVGFLLSGGLDSSLVCSVAAKLSDKPIKTFAIGMSTDAIDLKYAKQVADYIGSEHTEVIITEKDVKDALPTVVSFLGTYDITTIRASIGMYLVCKYIHEHTDEFGGYIDRRG